VEDAAGNWKQHDGLRRHEPRIGAATALWAVAAIGAGAYIVVLGSKLSFLLDDWTYILDRRGFDLDTFLQPFNEHLVAADVAIWKLLVALFGIGSTLPYRLVSTAMLLLSAWFLFVWVRRRIGARPALFATVPVLFLGAGFEDLLWFSSISFLGAAACGLGMLVALDRGDRAGDRLACVWLTASMLFSSLWLAFAVGAAADVALRRLERPWRPRAYLVTIPVVLYAIWWLGWGHSAESALSFANLAGTPRYVFDSIAAAIAAVLGLAIPVASTTAPNGLDWGQPLAVAAIAIAGRRVYRLQRVPTSLWVVLAIGMTFWILGGLDLKAGRTASASRYQVPGVIFLVLVAVELLRGVEFGRRLLGPATAILAAAVISNVVFFHQASESFLSTSQIERADLAAVEITRDTVDPEFFLDEPLAGTPYLHLDAGSYLSARDHFGSPAYTSAQLAGSPEPARLHADNVLAAILAIELKAAPAPPPAGGDTTVADATGPAEVPAAGCVRVPGGPESPLLRLPRGGVLLGATGGPIEDLRLARFATDEPSVDLRTAIPAGAGGELKIPRDRSDVPWRLRLDTGATATICGLGGRQSS
jgi:hypothetical protein